MGLSASITCTGGQRLRSRLDGLPCPRLVTAAVAYLDLIGSDPLRFDVSLPPLCCGDRQAGQARVASTIICLGKDSPLGIESLLVFLVVGAIAGWLAGLIVKGGGFGILGNIVVGIVGAFIAGLVFPTLGFALGGGILAAILHATIGAVILLVVIRLVKRA